jgi:hypothetical protein
MAAREAIIKIAEDNGWKVTSNDWWTANFDRRGRYIYTEWDRRGGLIYISTAERHYPRTAKDKRAKLVKELTKK